MNTQLRVVAVSVVAIAGMMLTADTLQAQRRRGGQGNAKIWEFLANKYDKNMDGELSQDEYDRGAETFTRLDRNKDGVLTKDDWDEARDSRGRGPGRRPSGVAPRVGDRAPDFELAFVNEPQKTVRLSSFVGKKPVALIFGSCT
jgi:hypothetical protein